MPFCMAFCMQVIVAASMVGLLERIKESNGLLDKINKGLNAYLEKKRLFFPRYIVCTVLIALSPFLCIFDFSLF